MSLHENRKPQTPLLPAPQAVTYPDETPLERPQSLSRRQALIVGAAVLAAMGIGGFAFVKTYDTIVVAPDRLIQRTIAAAQRDVDYNLPQLLSLIDLSDADMASTITSAGNMIVYLEHYPDNQDDSEGFDLYRIPETVSERDAEAWLNKGIAQLDELQGATFLNGSWRYTVYRYLTCAVRLQYADFSATTAQQAIDNALAYQGWNNVDTYTDAGTDDLGNTYQAGTVTVDDRSYEWRVSTVTLEDMYSLNLPVEGMFVGIRLTQIVQ